MYYPQLAVFDITVCAFSGFPISPCVIALLKLRILGAAAQLSPDQAHSLMDRLQIWPSIDLTERLKGAPFIVLIDWLEQVTVTSSSHTLANTFSFLSRCCPQEHCPLPFQQRFTTWFVDTCNNPSMESESLKLVEVIKTWLFRVPAEYFNDIEVRRALAAGLVVHLGILVQDESNGDRRHRINVIVARLSSPSDMVHHQENLVSVDDDATASELDSSRISCDNGYNTPTSQSHVDVQG
jgi:hypothetical protein